MDPTGNTKLLRNEAVTLEEALMMMYPGGLRRFVRVSTQDGEIIILEISDVNPLTMTILAT
ncbi:MAG: hypothetical protein ACR2NN_27820 [Bryobacteraceae bacterium]